MSAPSGCFWRSPKLLFHTTTGAPLVANSAALLYHRSMEKMEGFEAVAPPVSGLSKEQVRALAAEGHANIKVDNTQKTTRDIIRENVLTYFNLIFLVLTILLVIAGSFNSLTFLPVVIANMAIGIFQELRAKKVLDNLSVLNQPTAQVVRDGAERKVATTSLVLNDIIVLREGAQIPADATVVAGECSVNEALLTGEADEIEKGVGAELMSGSFVVSGVCYARLTRVGADSYISRLTLKAKRMKTHEQSEMVRDINRFVIAAGIAIVPIGIALLVQGLREGNGFQASVTSMVAAVIGMIPEGLYLLVSVTLAMSAMRLARRRVMLHDMKSIETLARVDVLCVDKTGTITDNDMLVAEAVLPVATDDSGYTEEMYDPVPETRGSRMNEYSILLGDYINNLTDDNITMKALREFFSPNTGKGAIEAQPFTSRLKYSAVEFGDGIFVLGAPDIVLGSNYARYEEQVRGYAGKGLRVLAFCRVTDATDIPQDIRAHEVEPLLFVMLQNPVRENAAETFQYFAEQDVEIRVISGDNPVTVSEVATQAGIKNAELYVDATTLTDDEKVLDAVARYTVFGRVTPELKQRLVQAYKHLGKTVAMTGDGVNDILAMKHADCSIAMAQGSDAAVQAAQVVLLDSDFSHMKEIVAEGRRDINNIERSATLFLVKNIFSLLLSVFSIANVLAYPLEPSQISLISMFNIGIPAFFLAMEPNEKKITGRFLPKVLLRAMPAALTDFLAIAALVVFAGTFGVASEDVSVAATFLLAIVGFMILIKICAPVNRYRVIVIAGCTLGIALAAVFFSDLFSITSVSTECIMLFVLFAIATEPFMRYLTRLFEMLRKRV